MKNKVIKKHYGDKDGLHALSYNAIITAILSNRNYGKTWTFKRRAFRRALKHGKKTIWLRLFKKEVKEAIATFFTSKDLQKYCGISVYDKDTNKDGNFKQIGNTCYYRVKLKNGKWTRWRWFLKIFALSDADAIRSADDVDVDTIVFDEFTKPAQKYRRYVGNIANDFIDILFSSKREHQVRCILIGNKESVNNPIFTYFNIKPMPTNWQGIKTFRQGSFVLQQINNKEETQSEYGQKMNALLNGTAYGNYIYKDAYKNESGFKSRKTPSSATLYCQLIINTQLIKISVNNGLFYVNMRVDTSKRIYCDVLPHKYKNELLLVKKQKRFFTTFINALADNRVYYDNAITYEAIQPFYTWLTI